MSSNQTKIPDVQSLVIRTHLIVFDFDGVFTDNTVWVNQHGEESVRCWRGDGIGLRILDRLGVEYMVISTEKNPVVGARCAKLGLEYRQGCENKAAILREEVKKKKHSADQVAFVGNDVNDRECLQAVGFPIVVADAHPEVRPLARYITEKPGGFGAVREVCDLFSATLTR
ncbi:KdsC family phosphatase [Gemmatimonadota bacterium]